MLVQIKATAQQQQLLLQKGFAADVELLWMEDAILPADLYIDCLFETAGPAFSAVQDQPVIVHALAATCNSLPEHYIRINAWPGFLEGKLTEFATQPNNQSKAFQLLEQIGWNPVLAPDEPGMIAARVVAMIINEAYFGLEDNISSKADIDTAMKLGTNYPYGPFVWAEKIGHENVVRLLNVLATTNSRYKPASLLVDASKK